MLLPEIFEELITVYNRQWFDESKQKFLNHPSNPQHSESFTATTINYADETRQSSTISLNSFLNGATDDGFDEIHTDIQENDHLETIGLDEENRPIQGLIPGHEFISANSFYPSPSLLEWRNKIKKEISVCLKIVESLSEKDAFFKYLRDTAWEFKKKVNTAYDDDHLQVILKIITALENYITNISERITLMQSVIEAHEKRLEFNLKQEQMAAVLFILNKSGFLNTMDYNDTGFINFCQQYFYFKLSGRYKRANSVRTLSDKYREFVRGENPKSLAEVRKRLEETLKDI